MKAVKTKNKPNNNLVSSSVAISDDGTIQITLNIPYSIIAETKKKVIEEHAKNTTVEGFRKGMAPYDKVEEKLDPNHVIQDTLSNILPQALFDAYKKHKIEPAIYPKLELLSADKDKPWQIRAITAELPRLDLGNYEEKIKSQSTGKIWTPGEEKKEMTNAEKEQKVIELLLTFADIKIPEIFIEQDVNTKLSQLIDQIQKLGLTLDNYLSSINKTADILRQEYTKQAKDSILLELSLNKIANDYNIDISEKEITDTLSTIGQTQNTDKPVDDQQKKVIKSILRRKKALEKLAQLI